MSRIGVTTKYSFLVIISLAMALLGLLTGPSNASFIDILEVLGGDKSSVIHTVIWDIRLPRVGVSLLAGGCLGLSGTLIQVSTRSPLGDPNLFGIGGGAVIFMALISAGVLSTNQFSTMIGAIVSSTIVSILLGLLVTQRNLSPIKLVIMGIGLGAITIAIATALFSHARVFSTQLLGLIGGSFTTSGWNSFMFLLITISLCAFITLVLSSKLQVITLGDTLSRSLGVNPVTTRFLSMSLAGILAGAAVYAGGIVGFVGLISPHIARRVFGYSAFHMSIGATLVGSTIVITSDQLARLLFSPIEIPVGLITTLVGAPTMMYLAYRLK